MEILIKWVCVMVAVVGVVSGQIGGAAEAGSDYQASQQLQRSSLFRNDDRRVGVNRFDTDQFATSQFATNRIGTAHFGTNQGRTNRFGVNQFDDTQVGTNQLGRNQVGRRQFGANQFGTSQLGINQRRTSQLDSTQFGAGVNQFGNDQQVGVTRFGSNQRGTNQFGSTRRRTNQFGANSLRQANQFRSSGQFGTSSQFGSSQTNQRFGSQDAGAAILSHRADNDGSGQYSFEYETENGIVVQESGQPVGLDSYAVSGSYSYTSPEGVEVTVNYLADENGFQVDSPNLPPVPAHARAQLQAAEEARRLGLPPQTGIPHLDQGGFQQNSNLQNLVSQNRNIGTNSPNFRGQNSNFNRASAFNDNAFQNAAGFRTNLAGQPQAFGATNTRRANAQFGTRNQFGSGNFQRATVIRRPLFGAVNNNPNQNFNEQNRQVIGNIEGFRSNSGFGQTSFGRSRSRFGEEDTSRQGVLGTSSTFGNRFNNQFEEDASGFGHDSTGSNFGQHSSRFPPRTARLRQQNSGGFARPAFQQRTASVLQIEQSGNEQHFTDDIENDNEDGESTETEYSELFHVSPLSSGIAGSPASHIFKS